MSITKAGCKRSS